MTKREADAMEQTIYAMSEHEYRGLVGWLASGCDGPLWHCVRPWRDRREAREVEDAVGA
jgi:hypothetical protein